jgi:hypothetical protein
MKGRIKPTEQVTIDEAASEKLSKGSSDAIGKIELTIETGNVPVFHFRATWQECELKFRWAKVFAGIIGVLRLLF